MEQSDSANDELLCAAVDVAPAGVRVAPPKGGNDLLKSDVVRLEFGGIRIDLVLLDHPAKTHDVRDSRDGF